MEEVKEYEISKIKDDLTTAYRYGEMIYSFDPRSNVLMASSEDEIFDDIPFNPNIESVEEAIVAHINFLIDNGTIEKVETKYSLINVLDDNKIPYKFDDIYEFFMELGIEKSLIFDVLRVLNIREHFIITDIKSFKLLKENYTYNIANDIFQYLITDYFDNLSTGDVKKAHDILTQEILSYDLKSEKLSDIQTRELTKHLWDNGYDKFGDNINKLFYAINQYRRNN